MGWLKWDDNATGNYKFAYIARRTRKPAAFAIALWAMLLERASKNPERGSIADFSPECADAALGMKEGASAQILAVMAEVGMIEDGRIANWEDWQPERSAPGARPMTSTERSQKRRAAQGQPRAKTPNATPCNEMQRDATPCNEMQRDATDSIKDKIREEEIREKTKGIKACAEPQAGSTPPAPAPSFLPATSGPVVMELPVSGDSAMPMHKVFAEDVAHWRELYPAVDVMQQLRHMRGWLEANPGKRKTRRGVARFIANWLAREQDKGGMARASPPAPGTQPRADTEYQKQKQDQRLMAQWLLQRGENRRMANGDTHNGKSESAPGDSQCSLQD